jgi:hypothetical protein
MEQAMIESAKRTDENNPAIYRWEPGADCQRVRAADDRSLTFFYGVAFLSPVSRAQKQNKLAVHPAVNCWAISDRPLRGLQNRTFDKAKI